MPSDAELIDQILAGECQQYAVLVKRYERVVLATAIRSVRESHSADDVAQDAFVAAYQSLSSLRDRSNFGGWLLSIVRNKAARACQQSHHRPITSQDTDWDTRVVVNEESAADSLDLLDLVERLPEQERVVIGLRHFDGHSMQEISNFTGRPIGTVTKQLSRAHSRLQVWITEGNTNEKHTTNH